MTYFKKFRINSTIWKGWRKVREMSQLDSNSHLEVKIAGTNFQE